MGLEKPPLDNRLILTAHPSVFSIKVSTICLLQGILADECGETVFSLRHAITRAIDADVRTLVSEHTDAQLGLVTGQFGYVIVRGTQG